MIVQHENSYHYKELLQFAKIVLSAPITNAWLEHRANIIKSINTIPGGKCGKFDMANLPTHQQI